MLGNVAGSCGRVDLSDVAEGGRPFCNEVGSGAGDGSALFLPPARAAFDARLAVVVPLEQFVVLPEWATCAEDEDEGAIPGSSSSGYGEGYSALISYPA